MTTIHVHPSNGVGFEHTKTLYQNSPKRFYDPLFMPFGNFLGKL